MRVFSIKLTRTFFNHRCDKCNRKIKIGSLINTVRGIDETTGFFIQKHIHLDWEKEPYAAGKKQEISLQDLSSVYRRR